MNKAELVKEAALTVETGQKAEAVVDCILDAIREALEQGERVSIAGFGAFGTQERSARRARNPRTGETIEIPAKRVPRFVPGSALRQAVNGSERQGG